jgi:hypothetical protein
MAFSAFDEYDLCPPYWPWPGPHRLELGPREGPSPEPWKKIPQGGQVSLQMLRALTIYNMAFQYHDPQARKDLQTLALGQLSTLTARLQEVTEREGKQA